MKDKAASELGGSHYGNLEARLADMEMRIAFQDDLVSALNDQVASQEQDLQRLWDSNRLLREQVTSLRESQSVDGDEEGPPPHY